MFVQPSAYPLHAEVSEPTGPAGGDLAGTYPNPTVIHAQANAIPSTAIQAEAVTEGKLAAAVQALLLGAGRVTEAMLAAPVIAKLLGTNNVTAGNLAAGAVTNPALGEESVSEAKIVAKAISLAKLATAVVERLVPTGGAEGQVLTKGATVPEWKTPSGGGGEITWQAIEGLNANLTNVNMRAGQLGGVIYLTGTITITVETLVKAILFTLPAGCRPEKEMRVGVATGTATSVNVNVKTNGEVEVLGTVKPTVTPLAFSAVLPLK